MILKISKSDFTKMPWKNGKGITQQIYIYPESSSLQKNDFDFRLSSAPITEDGEFSIFKGKNRILIPIKGNGFELNSQVYEKFEVAHFSGEESVYCALLKDSVVDLGLIYDHSKFKAQAKVLQLKSELQFSIEEDAHYLITLLSGSLAFEEKNLEELETLYFHNVSLCKLSIKKSSVLLFLQLTPIK